MARIARALCFFVLLAQLAGRAADAGGFQEFIDVLSTPSPAPGEVIAPVVVQKWDVRCIPITFKLNDTLGPVPNPIGPPVLSLAEAAAILRQAAELWNAVPTSFIEARLEGTTSNLGVVRFDQVNEVTFRTLPGFKIDSPRSIFAAGGFGSIVSIRSWRLLQDQFFSDGLDLDEDGDADASSSLESCADLDADGDIEFPVGLYRAGTILDTDIIFNAEAGGFRFTANDSQVDDDPRSVDFLAVAVHAFGLSHSLAHVPTSQAGRADGRDATLFPFIDTSDPRAERAQRHLDIDAITSISALYPEGSASSGPAALQPGDVALEEEFGFITGEVRYGARDEVLVGGSVFAVDPRSGEVVSTAVTGTSRYSSTPDGLSSTYLDAAFHNIDGKYRLVVPPGLYSIGIEAIDAQPVPAFAVNFQTILAGEIHQNDFDEDFWNGAGEAALERRPGERAVVRVRAGETISGVDIVTNRTRSIANYGSFDLRGFAGAQPGTYYAVRIPVEQYLAAVADVGGDAIVQGAAFLTAVEDASAVPVFEEALLTTGRALPDGTAALDLKSPLARQRGFVGQDFDFTPWWFDDSVGLARRIGDGIARRKIDSLFLVLRLPVAASGKLPEIGIDGGAGNDAPIHGLSYSSADGRVFTPSTEHNYMFKLILSKDPH